MIEDRPTRRQVLLGTAGLVAMTGLAGCQGTSAPLEPRLPADRLEAAGWRQIADIDEETSEEIELAGTTQEVHVETKADVFENVHPVQRVAERFEVDVDDSTVPAAVFLAAKTRIDPPVTRLLGISETALARAVDAAEGQAKQQLREQGFTNIRRIDQGTLEIEAGASATHRVYQADYHYESFEVTYEGHPISVDAGVFTVEAQLAVWPYRGLLVTGAGFYPGEEGQLTVTVHGTTRELSLDLRPGRYRDDVRELIQLVS